LGPLCCSFERRVPWPASCVPGLQGRLSRSALRGEARLCSLCSCSLRGEAQSGGSGCQGGDPWRAMGRGACASGLDAGAQGRLSCVPSRRKNSRDEPQSRTPPLETSPRGRNERGWPGDSKRSTEGSMKDQTTSIGAQRLEGGVGRLAPAAWHTTARTDHPARAGGSPGAAVACPQPALTGPATAALAGRAGTSPRRSPAGGVPVTPLGDSPASGGRPGRRRSAATRSRQGSEAALPTGAVAIRKAPWGVWGEKQRRSRHPCGA